MTDANSMETARARIVTAALDHVPFDGWSMTALRRGAADIGLDAETAEREFPGGAGSAIELWSRACDLRMAAALASAGETPDQRIRDRIANAVRWRIETVDGRREAVRRALSYLAQPQHVLLGTKLLYRTVDEIWYACGDTATDFNFYSKRGLLAGVYASTLLYWLDDASDGHAASWAFLGRRIDDVMKVPKLTARLGRKPHLPGMAFDPARFARRVATRLREGDCA